MSSRVWNATTCLWSGKWQGASVGTNSTPSKCSSPFSEVTASDTVTLPPNGSEDPRTWIVYLIAKGPGGTSRWSSIEIDQEGLSTGSTTTTTPTTTTSAPSVTTSPNWSGYVVPAATIITEASGEWTVPTLNCAATPNGGGSIWVGIGGYKWPTGGTSGELLQTGVEIQCLDGTQQDSGWYEWYPSTPNIPENFGSRFPVSSGDSIKASVYQLGDGAWVTRIDDLTTGLSGWMVSGVGWGVGEDSAGSFSEQGTAPAASYSGGYTAEWVVEDNGPSGSPVPFADYVTVAFTNLTTSLSSWSLTPAESIAIFQDGALLSQPSVPSNDGFSVSYTG